MVFYLCSAKIKIEYSFLLIIAFSILLKNENILLLLLFSSLHELAHLILLLTFKGKVKELNIAFYGIGLKYEYSLTFIEELLFFSAGAVVNLFLFVFSIHPEINGALALINLLPIYPLDGGRIIKLILNRLFLLDISDLLFKAISVITIIILIAYSAYTKNYSLTLISLYIIIFSINNTSD